MMTKWAAVTAGGCGGLCEAELAARPVVFVKLAGHMEREGGNGLDVAELMVFVDADVLTVKSSGFSYYRSI